MRKREGDTVEKKKKAEGRERGGLGGRQSSLAGKNGGFGSMG